VNVDVRPHLDFLDLDGLLLLASLSGLLLALVLEATVVKDLGDRRIGIGGNLDQVETRFAGKLKRPLDWYGTLVGALGVDQLDLADGDILIDARSILGGRRCLIGPANGGDLL
jgi:hypothetical protein